MDSIANSFVQIKNASKLGHKEVIITFSKMKMAILEILKSLDFVESFEALKDEDKKYPVGILVKIKYNSGIPAISELRRISRPGRRIYTTAKKIRQYKKGRSEILISTSVGLMSGKKAYQKGLGGEVIGEVK